MLNCDLSPLLRQWIGFDKLASSLQNSQNPQGFPPYNIEKRDENHYRLTLALAGFKQSELTLDVEGARLTVQGNPQAPSDSSAQYLHQGLVCKAFSQSFTLADHLQVTEARFEHGLLHIDLTRQVPEAHQPQHININSRQPTAQH